MPRDPFLDQSQDHGGPQVPALKAGQRLFNRRYELRQLLGAGGMGVVWLARDHTEQIDVALKFLPTVLALQEREMQRLREEVRAGKELRHENLLATYGMELEDGMAAIVLEYVAGETLRQKLDDQPRGFFEPDEIRPWVHDVCEGLTYLHEKAQRIHRDLKPANIMIDGEGRAKLMDFGISHRIKENVSRQSKTSEVQASSSSTLAYASPQQLSGKPSDKADDIYSLGATLYELLTGTPPFFRGGFEAVALQVKTEPITQLMERRQELVDEGLNACTGDAIPALIEQTVADCLRKEREKRPLTLNKVEATFSPEQSNKDPLFAAAPRQEQVIQQSPRTTVKSIFWKPFAASAVMLGLAWAVLNVNSTSSLRKDIKNTSTSSPALDIDRDSRELAELKMARGEVSSFPRGIGDASILVGEFASLTGKEATFGIASHEGTELAFEELNAAGGVLGKQFKLITEDDQSKAGESAQVVNKLISTDRVVAVLGEVASSRSLEAAPICQQKSIPMISPGSTNPKVTETGDFIFRVCFIDPFQGTVMANFATNTLKAKKVAVFTDVKSDYSKGLAKFFKEGFLKAGGQIVEELDFNGGDKDFKGQLTAIKSAAPDAVFVPGYYTDVALICVQAKHLGLDVPLIGGDGWESQTLLDIGKTAVEGHYFSTHYASDADSPKVQAFVAAYTKRYNGKVPDAVAALGYDSAMFLADAIKRAGSTEGTKLRDALAATKAFDAVTGKVAINEKRDAVKSAVVLQVKGGAFKFVETISP